MACRGYQIISTKEETIRRPDGSWATRKTTKVKERDGTVRIIVEEHVVEGPISGRLTITDGGKKNG